jgi:outer membrane lipoprotein-sorting protein
VFPFTMETEVEGVKQTESIQIESIKVNPKLEDALFVKPVVR